MRGVWRFILRFSSEESAFIAEHAYLEGAQLLAAFNSKFSERTLDSVVSHRNRLRRRRKGRALREPVEATFETLEEQWFYGSMRVAEARGFPKKPFTPKVSGMTSLCVALSDLHYGMQTPKFCMEVARKRIEEYFLRLQEEVARGSVDEIRVLGVGDHVDGEVVYKTHQVRLEAPAMIQVETCKKDLWWFLTTLREWFEIPVIYDAVYGNHGKTHPYAHETSNWDNVLVSHLATMSEMHDDPDLVVNYLGEEFNLLKIQDQRVMLNHRGVKHDGTPAMKIREAGWYASRLCDIFVQGHFHHWSFTNWLGRFHRIAGGSLCGANDHTGRLALDTPASQVYFKITKGRGAHSFEHIDWR
jgi:hypothetical protein